MCGRFDLHQLFSDIHDHYGLFGDLTFHPSYNITPSRKLPVARVRDGNRELALCQWGFVPRWMKGNPRSRPINARAETVADKPYFRTAFRHRRCLVPANGFYEWKRDGRQKQPWYFRLKDAEIFSFAGLWDHWQSPDGPLETFAVLTTGANDTMSPVHDRMPVILDPDQYDQWLDEGATDQLTPYRGEMVGYPVSRRVNSPANDDEKLIEPTGDL